MMRTVNRRQFMAAAAAATCPALAAPDVSASSKAMSRLQTGINLGSWISQYNRKAPEFDSRVTERDLAQIAGWGMDHVRLPIDYDFFEDDKTPYDYSDERLAYVDRCLEWAKKHRLSVVLDLHHAPGYTFMNAGRNLLFTSAEMQKRFLAIWSMFTDRFKSEGDWLWFELLNEVVEATPAEWNSLASRAMETIRKSDPERWVIVGGTRYNAISALTDIAIVDDARVAYTFHYYDHILFTHQKASWTKVCADYEKFTQGAQVPYPGEIPRLAEFVAAYPQYKSHARLAGKRLDAAWMRTDFQPAVDFVRDTAKPLYCGEYGVIRHAPVESKDKWYADLTALCEQHRIGRAAWSYKDGSFGFVDPRTNKPLDEELVKVASARWDKS
jgi:endoglucanase